MPMTMSRPTESFINENDLDRAWPSRASVLKSVCCRRLRGDSALV
jgi:hypothetical protein